MAEQKSDKVVGANTLESYGQVLRAYVRSQARRAVRKGSPGTRSFQDT